MAWFNSITTMKTTLILSLLISVSAFGDKPTDSYNALKKAGNPNYDSPFRQETPANDKLWSQLLDAITNTFPDHPCVYNLKAALADANGKPEGSQDTQNCLHEKL